MVLEAIFSKLIARIYKRARPRWCRVFSSHLNLIPELKIPDFEGGNGSYVGVIQKDTDVKLKNVYIFDTNKKMVEESHRRFGFNPAIIPEYGHHGFGRKLLSSCHFEEQ